MSHNTVTGTVLAVVLATVLNVLIYILGGVADVSYMATQAGATEPSKVSLGMVIMASIIPALLAGIGLWVLKRISSDALTIFLWVCAILSLISLIGPYSGAHDSGTFFTLGLMHVASALAIVFGLVPFTDRYLGE